LQAVTYAPYSRADFKRHAITAALFGLLVGLAECHDDDLHPYRRIAPQKCPHWLAQNPPTASYHHGKLAHREDG